ncbi:DUF5677 domain-containing protein [Limosilactobacillus reuteri]|uniref:DUF5677 domain-containing protein n=1 Tax=Limosilactobacillus reuteri TaxID=1598 RepID=UPI00117A6E7A|nr:DUF5677 domain-containing protein [Limosilactobacillus reuteri]MDE6948875.1 hypothetical protein [Limosilactobacillus sp.]
MLKLNQLSKNNMFVCQNVCHGQIKRSTQWESWVFFDAKGDSMSLEVTINDNEKLIDKLFENNSVFSKQKLTPSDVAIISLYYSALSNAKAITLLAKNGLTNVTDTLLRTFLEQSVYLTYIFQDNTEARAELLFFYEKMNSHTKALNIVKKLADKELAKNMQQRIDNQIKNDPSETSSLEESTEYFKKRYDRLFPRSIPNRNKIKQHWYNAEPDYKNTSFNQLCKNLGIKDLYLGMYAPYSDNTHGVNGITNFKVNHQDNEFNMIIEMYDKSSELTMLESELNLMFIRMASYYKIDGVNSWAKAIYSKIYSNVLLKRNYQRQQLLRKKGLR